jgi:hypothetical protein
MFVESMPPLIFVFEKAAKPEDRRLSFFSALIADSNSNTAH